MRVLKDQDGRRMFPGDLNIPERIFQFLRVDPDIYLNGPPP